MKKPTLKSVFDSSVVCCDVVRDEGLVACRTSLAGCLLGSPLGRLRTVSYSTLRRRLSLTLTPSRVQVPHICI